MSIERELIAGNEEVRWSCGSGPMNGEMTLTLTLVGYKPVTVTGRSWDELLRAIFGQQLSSAYHLQSESATEWRVQVNHSQFYRCFVTVRRDRCDEFAAILVAVIIAMNHCNRLEWSSE